MNQTKLVDPLEVPVEPALPAYTLNKQDKSVTAVVCSVFSSSRILCKPLDVEVQAKTLAILMDKRPLRGVCVFSLVFSESLFWAQMEHMYLILTCCAVMKTVASHSIKQQQILFLACT